MNKKALIISALIASLLAMLLAGCSDQSTASNDSATYAEALFDASRVHTIEVSMLEEDRADQLANPKDKTRYEADVVIDGEKVEDVLFHTKAIRASTSQPMRAGTSSAMASSSAAVRKGALSTGWES